jgi:tryptophanase
MDYIAAGLKNVFDRRNEIKKGYKITWEPPILRHFTVKLEEADGLVKMDKSRFK